MSNEILEKAKSDQGILSHLHHALDDLFASLVEHQQLNGQILVYLSNVDHPDLQTVVNLSVTISPAEPKPHGTNDRPRQQ